LYPFTAAWAPDFGPGSSALEKTETMQGSLPIIQAVQITKRYGKLTAVDHLDLTIPQGICLGLLGPNGAGKTTLIEIIEDIIEPTSGQVLYRGRSRTAAFREQIGIMFQQTALLNFMTVGETLVTFQSLYSRCHDIDYLVDLCHLGDIRHQQNDKISGGQRQRLLLALALINRPDLIFLDEPSTGLDPQARRNLWDIVEEIKAQGKTIILTTHYMEEAHQLCDQVAIMDHGRIIALGTPGQLIDRHGGGIRIVLPEESYAAVDGQLPFETRNPDHTIEIKVDEMNRAVETLIRAGVDLNRMQVQAPSLEAVFLNLTGRRLRE
jgi:ABC-2 type transport system ATP-binding protein